MSVAVTSLPVPLSPVISTVLSLCPMTRRNSKTARMRALSPTTTESIVRAVGVMGRLESDQAKGLEFGNLFAERRFDAEIQRHVRAGTARAHAGQANLGAVAVDADDLDVAPVGLQKWTHATEHRFDPFFGH